MLQHNIILLLEVLDVLEFAGHDEADALAASCYSCCSADPIDVVLDRRRKIPLDHPLHVFKVKSSGGNIGADEQRFVVFVELHVVVFAVAVVHVAVQLVDASLEQRAWLLLSFLLLLLLEVCYFEFLATSLVDALAPVELG